MTKSVPMTAQQPSLLMRATVAAALLVAAASVIQPARAEGFNRSPGREMAGRSPDALMFSGQPEHLVQMVDRLLDGLSATDAQRAQIKQIAMAAAADIKTQRDSVRSLREKGLQIFTAPAVDAAAAEAVRQQMSARLDMASKRYLTAMLDVSNVLTPEQRATIGDRAKQRLARLRDREQRDRPDHREQDERATPRSKP